MFDSHLHLQDLPDAAAAVTEALAAGVTGLLTMGVDPGDNRVAVQLAQELPSVHAGVGHHPVNSEPPDWGLLRELAGHPKVVALGEVGLDATHPEQASMAVQVSWLHILCDLSLELGLPLSFHCREAAEQLYDVVREHPGVRGVMHYFALDWEWAERFLGLGLHLSFSGLITRPSRAELREVARRCPADRLLLETDSPFGTPQGRRGQANRPAWLMDTAALVAELRETSIAGLEQMQAANATALFSRLLC